MKSSMSRKAEQIEMLRAQCGASSKMGPQGSAIVASKRDRIEYITDMIAEMSEMARAADCGELARRLDCAYDEALKFRTERRSV